LGFFYIRQDIVGRIFALTDRRHGPCWTILSVSGVYVTCVIFKRQPTTSPKPEAPAYLRGGTPPHHQALPGFEKHNKLKIPVGQANGTTWSLSGMRGLNGKGVWAD